MPATKRGKTALFLVLVIVSNAFGNLFLSLGMKRSLAFAAAGVALLILWTLARMALLSWADLSYVLPVTAIGYAVNALLGRVVLGEQVTGERWLGVALVVLGSALAAKRS